MSRLGPYAFCAVLLPLAAACATSRPPAEAAAAPGPTGPTREVEPPAPGGDAARRIDSATALAGLCDRLTDEDRLTFAGGEVEQAHARAEHRSARRQAEVGLYTADLPATQFRFQPYELGDRQLTLDARAFPLGDGAEIYTTESGHELVFPLPSEQAEHLLAAQEAGQLGLRVFFRPLKSEVRAEPCLRLGGGIVKASVQVVSAVLLDRQGTPLARAGSEDVGPAPPVAAPTVRVRRPSAEDPRELPPALATAVEALSPQLVGCYKEALTRQPTVRGLLVVDARVGSDGHLSAPRMEMSALADDKLIACALAELTKARLPSPKAPVRLSIPIHFGPPAEGP